ncbi:hypothetical protein VAA_02564 [Vibrio anguillarum 775]|nr:hypothetical protein VAA_02564 [Vibrio anguillarum 775]
MRLFYWQADLGSLAAQLPSSKHDTLAKSGNDGFQRR